MASITKLVVVKWKYHFTQSTQINYCKIFFVYNNNNTC